MSEGKIATYKVREVAAVFRSVEALETALERLTEKGFNDGDFNIMAADAAVREKLADRLVPVEELADDANVVRKAFEAPGTRRLKQAAVFGLPMYLLGAAGALGVVATGGAAALALAGAITGGAVGAGIGAVLANILEEEHAEELAKALEAGGIVLWVRVSDDESEKVAIEELKAAGGENVHAHEIERTWGVEDIPLSDFNPDPFTVRDPVR